jgi:tetratricopeptide (TPR) repeat protein
VARTKERLMRTDATLAAVEALLRDGRLETAAAQLSTWLELARPGADELGRAAGLALSLGTPALALAVARRFVAVAPDFAGSQHALGLALAQSGEHDAAMLALRRALELAPQMPLINRHLGEVALALGDASAARAAFDASLAARPDQPEARFGRGSACLQLGLGREAAADFEWLVRRLPDEPNAWRGLGEALEIVGLLERSEAARRCEIELDPNNAERQREYGIALTRRGGIREARVALERALVLDPRDLRAQWSHWQSLPLIYADDTELADWRKQWHEGLARFEALNPKTLERAQLAQTLPVQSNFLAHYQGGDLLPTQRRYGALIERWANALYPTPAVRREPRRDGRLRVGFASAFLRNHTVFGLFGNWLIELDRARFAVEAFHFGLVQDSVTNALANVVDRMHVGPKSIDQWRAALIEADLDALIWLDVGMDGVAQVLSAQRYAPFTAVAWGHPVTTGLASVDAFLSGAAMELPDADTHYTERLVRLPGLGIRYELPDAARTHVRRPLDPAAPRLLCAQSVFKILPDSQQLLARVAARLPDARLDFIPHPVPQVRAEFAAQMRRVFAAHGLDFDARAVLHPFLTRDAFLERMREADVLLDVLGWSGGHTTLEGLAFDLPVVTCPGPYMRSRHTHGMLCLSGLERELSVGDTDAYVETVAALASDRERHAAVVAAIAARKHVLFENDAASALGAAIWKACGREAE